MKNVLLKLFVVLLFQSRLSAQEELTYITSINKPSDFINTDRLGNLYLIKQNYIWMYNRTGDSLRAFNSKRYGEISFLDATDPYKLLIFFRDYNLGLFLDNFLSENGAAIDLQELGFDQVSMMCLSRENGFWIFDQIEQKVIRLNENFKITHQSVNFNQWFGEVVTPNYMIQYNNRLYLNDFDHGIFVFDHFGTYLKRIPLKGLKDLQVLDGIISYHDKNSYCNYRLMEMDNSCQPLKESKVMDARKEKGRFYLQLPKKTIIYSTN